MISDAVTEAPVAYVDSCVISAMGSTREYLDVECKYDTDLFIYLFIYSSFI